ncbi:MAG TPA: hypothetical protein VEL28_04680 [Candidatus Binatia bacterium]|nr:hypothetical protein [Candidatus Binatia bacterium]
MNESTKRRWDVRLGIATPIITVLGIIVGVWQFNSGERNKVEVENSLVERRATMEFERKLWLERLEAYRNVAKTTGRLVASAGRPEFDENLQTFLSAYWGTMIFVEDPEVAAAMKAFYEEALDYRTGFGGEQYLKIRAAKLLETCRSSIEHRPPPSNPATD